MRTRPSGVAAGRRVWTGLGVSSLCVPLLVACGMNSPQPQPQAQQPLINRTALAPNAQLATVGSAITESVRRGTIHDTITIPGKVAPAASVDLLAHGAGTITALNVHAGQGVTRDTVLAELTLDPDVVDSARSRAAMADLALETQQARVDDLRKGASPDALASARADLAKAQTELSRTRVAQDALQSQNAQVDQARAASKDAADRQVTLAQLGVQQATDDLAVAQREVTRAQTPGLDKTPVADDAVARAQDQADSDLAAAAAAQRSAARKVQQAALKVQETQDKPNEHKASLDLAAAEAQLGRADRDLKATQAEADQHDPTKDPTGIIAAGAVDKIHAASRDFETTQDQVARLRDALTSARTEDARAIQAAQLDADQARDELAAANASQSRTQRTADRLVADAKKGTPSPTTVLQTGQPGGASAEDPVQAAQARARAAERQVQAATVKLQEAQAAQTAADTTQDSRSHVADLDVQAAQAGVDAAQARLNELGRGPDAATLDREQRRVNVLQQDAEAAHVALQPVQALKSPFDGAVADVNVQLGQVVDNRTSIARVVASEGLSVVAAASERDVTYLAPDKPIDLTFPGLGDVAGTGTIAEIAESATTTAGTTTTTASTNRTDQVTYPVRVALTSAPSNLKLGMTAMLNIQLGQADDVLYVSSDTVRKVDGFNVLTLVNPDGTLKDVNVELGGTYGTNVAVKSGVNEGDIVAVVTPAVAGGSAAAAAPSKP